MIKKGNLFKIYLLFSIITTASSQAPSKEKKAFSKLNEKIITFFKYQIFMAKKYKLNPRDDP